MKFCRGSRGGKIVGVCLLALAAGTAFGQGAGPVPPVVIQAETARIEAMARAARVAISVFPPSGVGGGGSGVVISPDGFALTNYHVVLPVGNHLRCSMPDGVLYDAVIVGIDPTGDLALIKLLGRDDFPHAELGDSDTVQVGDWCFAVGNPFLLATDFQPTITYGIVSGVHRYQYPSGTLLEYADCIQTDAAINPGNSGGPLFDAEGRLIGINGRGSFEKRGRVNVGVGYAISIKQVKNFLGNLHSGRIVDHATLGASVATDDEGRVVVSNILESSDAYRRGLRYGDELVAFGGRPIQTVNGFKNALGIFPRGWRVPLSYRRDGVRKDIHVRLAGVHSTEELLDKLKSGPPLPGPKPKRDKPPKDRAPGDPDEPEIPAEAPDRSRPRDAGAAEDRPPLPKIVAQHFQARRGYANYYFNQLHRDRIWKAVSSQTKLVGRTGSWNMNGALDQGGPVQIELHADQATVQLPTGQYTAAFAADLDDQRDPPGSGGLLLALHAWQRFLTLGPDRFGEVYYVGTAPLPGRDGLVDVLAATHDVLECQFWTDPQSGELVGLEVYADSGEDPCEIYFEDYRQVDDARLPHRLTVRHGDDLFAVFLLDTWVLSPAGEGESEGESGRDGGQEKEEA